ncbi:tyrosine-type recombinase/integrase [Paenibacillus sp. FSL R10-2734]|uniref:tyrosine-type recombinase/integrase n=1 Tax=Paenibacillus sp. FSL R10-2734 TaxID=2954691 RepID=UPI0030DC8215
MRGGDHNGDTLINLINAPDQKTFLGQRDYALILLTLDTGVRPKEAFTLLPNEFNPRANELYVRAENAKTRVSRTLNISSQTAKAFSDLINSTSPQGMEERNAYILYK